MARYIAARLLWTVVTLFALAAITFALMHRVPGGPFDAASVDRPLPAAVLEAQQAYYGLDDPVPVQFGRYLGHLVRGNLGVSFAQQGRPVTDLMLDKMWPSLLLGLMAFGVVVGGGVPLGVLAATHRGRAVDTVALGVATALAAVPSFVLAFVLLLIFSVWLGWTPVFMGAGFGESLSSLPRGIVPAIALGAPAMALISRITRASMLEALEQDYVRTARAKGLSPLAVTLRHALRNALIPVVTVLGPVLAGLITGSIIIESIFGVPGIGSAFITSVTARDYGVIMGTTLLYGAVIMLVNLAVDLAYPVLDPRVTLR
ncbi:MAG: ABC transporter permease [Chloroflexi bacterium]|nr:ABC transporter permease [Chloroflexota bacterium]MDA1239994.1 ABC transporter permease [Chloroflexota bacterium]